MTKMTYVEALNTVIGMVDGEVAEKLTALRDQIAKKNSAERKPSKAQVANEELRGKIVALLSEAENPMTATEIAEVFGVSNQKITSLMGKLIESQAVVREVINHKAKFRVA